MRLRWVGAALAAIGFAVLGAMWARLSTVDGGDLRSPESWLRPVRLSQLRVVTGAIGGWSMLRAPRATIFVFVIGLVTPWFYVLCVGLLVAPLLPARTRADPERSR